MPHRDDLAAAHARIAALERELSAAKKQNRAPLRCARCRGAFESGDVDRTSGLLICRNCRTALNAARPAPTHRGLPLAFEVEETPQRLRITWPWHISGLQVGVLVVLGFIFVLICVGGIQDADDTGEKVLAGTFLGLVVLVIAYTVIASLLNRTTVLLSDRRLLIETRPIALRRSRSLSEGEIDQLFCMIGHSKFSTWYEVWAELKDGRRLRLVMFLGDAGSAFFLERAIEDRLGIADRAIEGEVPRRDR